MNLLLLDLLLVGFDLLVGGHLLIVEVAHPLHLHLLVLLLLLPVMLVVVLVWNLSVKVHALFVLRHFLIAARVADFLFFLVKVGGQPVFVLTVLSLGLLDIFFSLAFFFYVACFEFLTFIVLFPVALPICRLLI